MFDDSPNSKKVIAEVRDDALVVSLPNALEPSIWRVSLDDLQRGAFTVSSSDGRFDLLQQDRKTGEEQVIAQFIDKEDAKTALDKILDALLTHDGEAMSPLTARALLKGALKWGLVTVIYIALTFYILVPYSMGVYIENLSTLMTDAAVTNTADSHQENDAAPESPADLDPGVPVDADQFFSE